MTPETRAARDSLARFLALPEYASDDVRVLGLCRSGQSHYDAPVTTGQLRTILAALDQTDRQVQEARVIALREISRPDTAMRPSDYEIYLATGGEPLGGVIEFPTGMAAGDMERFAATWDAAQGPERALTLNLDNRTAVFRAKPYPADWSAGPRGQCEDCSCCVASGCHRGPDATCPTDRLGDSACPCTED